jgi:hypothetical protein
VNEEPHDGARPHAEGNGYDHDDGCDCHDD